MENSLASDAQTYVRMFEESEEATRDARLLCERDIDYRDNKQWTPEEEAALKRRKQPVVTYNRIQRKVDFLSGLERQQRKDPRAFPRNPADEGAADAATDAIRFVCDRENWDAKRSEAWDDILTPGTGAVMVGHRETKDGIDPAIICIPWDRFFYDPHSARADFSDAQYMGIVTWYDLEAAKRKWSDKADIITDTWQTDKNTETYDDRPKERLWSDYKRKRVRVIEMYHRNEGEWKRCVFTKSGNLEDPQASPYLDDQGQPENPIKARSLYVDRDNDRFGAVRVLISPQDEINKRRSKGLHLITMRQARIGLSATDDRERIRRELAKPDGIIDAEREDFEILNTNDMAAQNLAMLQEAKNEIDLLGANAALSGKNEKDMSGRAILAQQQGGMVEVARMFDRLSSLSIDVYEAIWNRIRQFWDQERWVRVTDNERNLRFVGLNQQVTIAQLAQEVAEGDQDAIAKASQIVGPQVMQAYMAGDEQAQVMLGLFVQQNGQQVVEIRNAVNELDVDIVIDEGMDTPSVQAEQFDTLAKMLPGLGPLAQSPAALRALIEASALRNKDALLEELDKLDQPNPMQAQMQQEAMQLQKADAVAEIEKKQSETAENMAQAESESMNAQAALLQAMQPEYRAA